MNKTDKETLVDIYQSIKDLVEEAENILTLEGPKSVLDRAVSGWISDIKRALGTGKYIETFYPTFWITLEELGILTNDGKITDLRDDDEKDVHTATEPSQNNLNKEMVNAISSLDEDRIERLKQETDDEDEDFVESVYVLDASKEDNPGSESKTCRVVEAVDPKVSVDDKTSVVEQKPTIDLSMSLGGVWNYE